MREKKLNDKTSFLDIETPHARSLNAKHISRVTDRRWIHAIAALKKFFHSARLQLPRVTRQTEAVMKNMRIGKLIS